jgi:hypothetical protein
MATKKIAKTKTAVIKKTNTIVSSVPTKETKEQLIKRLEAMDAKHWNLYRIEK